jgi:UDP-N-acetylmuramate--alanine ligase
VLVFGGSLGARSINLTAFEAFATRERSAGSPDVVLHVSGRRDHEELASRLARLESPDPGYRLHDYVETLADPLAAADLVVARAGGSVFELAAAGAPAVLVPYPHATGDHQSGNARWMEEAGAAIVVPDEEFDAARLARVVGSLLEDPKRLHEMSAAARRLARPDAARDVAAEVLDAAGAEAPAGAPWAGRRLHFVGIGGAGMSGLALVSRQLGAQVSGCDRSESPYTAMLRGAGVVPVVGHSPDHVQPGMEVVVSTAVPEGELELVAAREQGAPVIRRGSLLAQVASHRRLIAVAGTHGKTTTAAMAAHCLAACGLDPGYVIGAELRAGGELSPNAELGGGAWMVAETDESDGSFLELAPEVAVVTNVELDHHTTYGSLADVEGAFRAFLERLAAGGAAVVWNRPQLLGLVPEGTRVITFGIEEPGPVRNSDISARNLGPAGLGTRFELVRAGEVVCESTVPVPGVHNVLNALAALATAEAAGCDLERAARSLEGFQAVGRRFELKGEGGGVRVFDDYAHHPTEVTATIEAARALEPARLIVVFQPHLYSRTLHLHRELGRALAKADVAVVLDVYAARERPEGELAGITGKLVADASADAAGGKQVWWLPTLDEAEAVLSREMRDGDVVVTLGAGDVDRLGARLAALLA